MIPRLGLTRTVVRRNYALIARDSYVSSVLPGWSGCTSFVILSATMGAGIVQLLIECQVGARGALSTGADEWFVFVIKGAGTLNGAALGGGSFAYIPPQTMLEFSGASEGTQLLIFRKRYELLEGVAAPRFFSAKESDLPETPFLGDPHARLKTLLPDSAGADMAVNIFTYDPGATLPFVETHVMEHGMLFLSGSGVYRLDDDWHPVTAGDSIWIAPYCPQWFIAGGPEPARYIYYKDVNRMPR